MLLTIKVSAKELSTYEGGTLVFSSQLRKTNNRTTVQKETRLVGRNYEVWEDGQKAVLSIPGIQVNLLSLYFQEPVGIRSVYSDNYASMMKLSRTPDGGYKVDLPDGSNTFYYAAGTCTKIKLVHSLYTAEIIRKQ
jgi:hypothetical protein